MKGVTRNSNSWIVRIYRNGKAVSTSFADSKYGGENEALEAAKSFLEKANKEIPPTSESFLKKLLRNNKTGKTGVSKTHTYGGSGNKLPCYLATWTDANGKKQKRTFTYLEGDDQSEKDAFSKACQARDKAENEK